MKVLRLCFCSVLLIFGIFDSASSQWENTANVVKETFYGLYAPISSVVTNPECLTESKIYHTGLMENKIWAQKMLDASGKIPTGIFSGNKADLGQFDQCYNAFEHVDEVDIIGKYCLAQIIFHDLSGSLRNEEVRQIAQERKINDNVFFFNEQNATDIATERSVFNEYTMYWAICVPSACEAKDVENHLNAIIPAIINGVGVSTTVEVKENACQDKTTAPKLSGWGWVVLVVMLLIGLLMFGQTLYEGYLMYIESEPTNELLVSFSIINNGKKLLRVSKSREQFHCLNGIRWLSMMWVVLGHKIMYAGTAKASFNPLDLAKWLEQWYNYIPLGAMVAVDTFLLMSGMLAMYLYLRTKSAGKPVNVVLMYIHRYLRLTPPILFTLLFVLFFSQFLGSGPFWPQTLEKERVDCEKSWWALLLYIQNYRHSSHICLAHTWYLSTDFQMFLLAPIFMIAAWKFPKYAVKFHLLALGIFTVVSFTIVYVYDLNVAYLGMMSDLDFFFKYYFPVHTRIGAYLVGLLLGWIMFEKKKTIVVINTYMNLLCWFVCLSVMFMILLWQYPMNQEGYARVRVVESFYESVHRPVWCICMAWIIYACSFGYGGPINWFLSLPLFQILGRLTYCMYITHYLVLNYRMVAGIKIPHYFSSTSLYWEYWGDLFVITFVGTIWSLAFELPFGNLEDFLFKRPTPKSVREKSIQEHLPRFTLEKTNDGDMTRV